MNREILFRGKRIDNGKWVEGYYVKAEKLDHSGDEHFIIEYAADGKTYEVIPETVGEYTGLTDKNGKKIFEDDVVTGYFVHENITGYIFYGEEATFYIERGGLYSIGLNNASIWLEVIGNIHDKSK